ncbi:MAG: CHAD domain-containing protein [Spirulina sp. SIO3F2]|nr:CHAD domain-containing protein [Spirulina sp. SIO3F2]
MSSNPNSEVSWGDYAHMLIQKHYQQITKQRPKVLADRDPEPLHKMRVGLRRLRATLKTFGEVLNLPLKQENRALRKLGRQLGQLRDLDVQLESLQQTYRPRLPKTERQALDQLIKKLGKRRQKVAKQVYRVLRDRPYRRFKKTYQQWLQTPLKGALADRAANIMATPVLQAQLEQLLAHPGWQISGQQMLRDHELETLHDLRKLIKQTRYQAEFFAPIHSQAFCQWLTELKLLQENLGAIQDAVVLAAWLGQYVKHPETLNALQQEFHQNRTAALQDWERLRQGYLSDAGHQNLRALVTIAQPKDPVLPLQPQQQMLVNLNSELRTPLQTIVGRLAQLQGSRPLTPEQRQSLLQIRTCTTQMAHVLQDLLTMTHNDLQPTSAPLADTVELTVFLNTIVQIYTLHATDQGLTLQFQPSPTLPSHIKVQERLLRQVLNALLENAIRYTPQGQITLRVRSLPLTIGQPLNSQHNCGLRIEVEDMGVGLSAVDRERVFEPFVQIGAANQLPGLGLGLTLSRHAVRQMGGELQVATIPTQGSIFWFEIPVEVLMPSSSFPGSVPTATDRSVVLPQPNLLQSLYHAACDGDLKQVKTAAQQLAQQDDLYQPFVNQLLQLIAQQSPLAAQSAIAQWLEPYLVLR